MFCDESARAAMHIDAVILNKLGMEILNTMGYGEAFTEAFAAAEVEGFDDITALRRGERWKADRQHDSRLEFQEEGRNSKEIICLNIASCNVAGGSLWPEDRRE